MGRRNRFVVDEVVRLMLADVYKRNLDKLVEKGVEIDDPNTPKKKIWREATKDELEQAQIALEYERADGAWIEVKKELTAWEAREAFSKQINTMHFGEQATIDPRQIDFAKVGVYVIRWNLVDEDEKPIPFSEAALKNVDAATFGEIVAAVDHHETLMLEAQAALKNAMAGTTRS